MQSGSVELATVKAIFITIFVALTYVVIRLLKNLEDYQKIFKDIIIEGKPYPAELLKELSNLEDEVE